MTSTMATSDIIIKQYRISGRCCVRSGGHHIAGLNDGVQAATITLENTQDQRDAVDNVMDGHGYVLARFERDDYGNTLLTYAVAKEMRIAA
jgi:hypothetical protein